MTVHKGRWRRSDRAEAIYRYVPVEVPAGADGLEVTLSYDRDGGVLDLGCFGPNGFRGWSGGARDRYAITAGGATPGYLPGELEPGEWLVALGLHRVAADGTGFEVTATTGPTVVDPTPAPPPMPERPPARDLPAPAGMRWLAGDLHAHTVHSDGSLTVDELAARAVGRGLDFLAVTDHNTVSHHPYLAEVGARYGIALLPGQEVTTDLAHGNVFGDVGWIDFREPPQRWVDEAAARDALMAVNHPLGADCAWRAPLERHPPLAEVWHGEWPDPRWGGQIAWWEAWGLSATAIGGSDFHRPGGGAELGVPTTWVLAEDATADAVLAGLRTGRVAVGRDRLAPVLLRLGDELLAVDAADTLLVEPSGRRVAARPRMPAGPGPYRLDDHDGAMIALCT